MSKYTTGWVIFIGAMGMTLGLLGQEIKDLESWQYLTTPAFIGKSLVHLATVVASFVGGRIMPTSDSR